MTSQRCISFAILLALAGPCSQQAMAQPLSPVDDVESAKQALERAQAEGAATRRRAEMLEKRAILATQQVEKAAQEAAATAARIQETEAELSRAEAQVRIIDARLDGLTAKLAERQRPLMRLTAALQRLSRRPSFLALLKPGSVGDAMHLRALLETLIPEIENRTADLRADIAVVRQLAKRAKAAAAEVRVIQAKLQEKRERLVAMETRARLRSRKASSIASMESEKALGLAERAKDLVGLVEEVGKQGELRNRLAVLPGPLMRPAQPEKAQVDESVTASAVAGDLKGYTLPVSGRIVAGFGDELSGRPKSRGVMLATRSEAQAVAPAKGRVAFAGPYRGYGDIVIIEHDGGWTSVVTGLAQLDAEVGDQLVEGAPIGRAGKADPVVTVELRRAGEPVNPLQYIGS